MTARVLFVLKRREDYSDDASYSHHGVSTGLLNSAKFVSDMLNRTGVESKLAVVLDNNCIDREVNAYKPTHVIIEALWVVPSKFEVLAKLHPEVKWIVRFHSETPFIASEGIAMSWLHEYSTHPNVSIGINAPRFMREVNYILSSSGVTDKQIKHKVHYLPNYYPIEIKARAKPRQHTYLDVGCFGAIRPLKNQLIQAIAAIRFADTIGKQLRFHINVGRVEMKGDPILHNLRGLFDGLAHRSHELITHQWMPHNEFTNLVATMDIGMQVSFSETFNIVAADMTMAGVPIVVSSEVPWAVSGIADPVDSHAMCKALTTTWKHPHVNVFANQWGLRRYVSKTEKIWKQLFLE